MGQYANVTFESGHRPCVRPRLAWLGAGVWALLWPWSLNAQGLADTPDAGMTPDTGLAPTPATAAAPPATPSEFVAAQVGVRSLAVLQDPDGRGKLGDVGAIGEADVVLWGQVHPFLKWQAGFLGALGESATTSAVLLDLVAKVELADACNLWIGRMPIPADRAGLSTAWAIAPWTLPGHYESFAAISPAGSRPAAGPRQGDLGRGDGVTLWGQVRGGRFKYYLGAYGLDQPERSPLYSARLALDLLDPEPGFRTSSAYYGAKEVLAIGVGAQHRTQGSRPPETSTTVPAPLPANFDEVNADILFEIGNGSAGVLDLEGAYAKLWGANEVVSYQFFGLASYVVPLEVGFGRFQPLVRIQHAGPGSGEDRGDFTSIDTQLGYVVDGHHARLSAGWEYTRARGQAENAILLGIQLLSRGK
jgi:hypothetical protein